MAIKMTEDSRKIFKYLKSVGADVGVKFTVKQVQEALGIEKVGLVTGLITGLCRKGYIERFKEVVKTEDGKTKEVSYFCLTETGATFNLDISSALDVDVESLSELLNCPNCGAPINKDKDKCEYCDTFYNVRRR